MYDIVIIGAGMSGLAAGIRLSHYEKKVCILEKHSLIGGLNSYYRAGGYNFDVGLHAMTNFIKKGEKKKPLSKLIRQLKLRYEDFALVEQKLSKVVFSSDELTFSNDFNCFLGQINEKFPEEKKGFNKLVDYIKEYNEVALDHKPVSARKILSDYIKTPILIDMILCPLMYYGCADEHDMEFAQFVIMFKSIFFEGFARPYEGVRKILKVLKEKYQKNGGELRINTGVKSIKTKDNKVDYIELDNGEKIYTKKIISSAGLVETYKLLGREKEINYSPGQLSFVESIFILDRQPSELGYDTTIIFYNDSDKFDYRKPNVPIDLRSGVICCPNNFDFKETLDPPMIRVTHMANYDYWDQLSPEKYKEEKEKWQAKSLETISKYLPDFKNNIKYTDFFTPKTIFKFTDHINGAVYGAPEKIRDGKTDIENLFLCGTDQGFLGIVGAMLSGISMANLHGLMN